jgi:hypothetical protein
MTTEVAWLMIIANVVIAAITIANSWGLAWYAKQRKKRTKKQSVENLAVETQASPTLRRTAPYGLIVILSGLTVMYSMVHPNPDLNIQIVQIALSVGLAVLAIALSLISPLVESNSAQWQALIQITELSTKMAEALPKKSPNTTAEADARNDSARGSP